MNIRNRIPRLVILFLLLVLPSISLSFDSSVFAIKSTGTVDVYFSPEGGATNAIVEEIISAKREILVLANAGIPTYIDDRHAIAHNKIIIIDQQTLITGSFNFTKAAEEKNAENMLVIKDNPPLIQKYIENYIKHKEHSTPYKK